MLNSKYRYVVPNGITFASLTCGSLSIMSSMSEAYLLAGGLVLTSYILDLFDGASARKLNASSEFGLQLDSLVDLVSLGVAPAMLMFSYLNSAGYQSPLLWVVTILFILAGAFRLARFNLLPPKTSSSEESVGLTISSGGATLALALLANLASDAPLMSTDLFMPLMFVVSLLMASTIPYPSFGQVFQHKIVTPLTLLGGVAIAIYLFNIIQAWFICTLSYLAISLARAGYQKVNGH